MHGVGFEPTRIATADLKTAPLVHSGNRASYTSYMDGITLNRIDY